MTRVLPALALLLLAAAPLFAADALTYHGEAGRVAEYHLSFTATGRQTVLEVSKPVQLEAEYVLREQVLTLDPDGSLYLQLSGRITKWKDKTGAFAGQRADLPPTQMHISPRGEVLAASSSPEAGPPDLRARAAAALLGPPIPIILPEGPVEVGATWEWTRGGATQANRLAGVTEADLQPVRITSTGRAPIDLHEASDALGLIVATTGEETQTSVLDFSRLHGLPLRHKGNAALDTKTQVDMESADGVRSFHLNLSLRVEFDLKLTRLDGKPV